MIQDLRPDTARRRQTEAAPLWRHPATKPCPFCGGTEFSYVDDTSPEDKHLFADEPQADPPPGGWRMVERPKCDRCDAMGPQGYVMNADETAVLIGPTWDDRDDVAWKALRALWEIRPSNWEEDPELVEAWAIAGEAFSVARG